jgi:hypothetical protein
VTLDATGFGWVETGGRRFDHDIVVYPDGRVENRYDGLAGSNHRLEPDEARRVLDNTGADLVVGTGQYGLLRVAPATREMLEGLGVRLHVQTTPRAIETFNRIAGPRCAVLHVTC